MTTAIVATCSARAGWAAGDYGIEPLWCHQTRGLRSYVDALGLTRHYCARHEEIVRGRWPERYVSERADDPECLSCGPGMRPPHNASERCQSGGRNHCSCDVCF